MKILTPEEFTSRFEFVGPIHPAPEEKQGAWCIPFEYGSNVKGTRISIAKAKEIAAELRAAVAEAEKRLVLEAFQDEKARCEALREQLSKEHQKSFEERTKVAELKARLLRSRKK